MNKPKKQIEAFITDYTTTLDKAAESGGKICRVLKNALKEIGIKNVTWSLGWEEGGIDQLCFFSEKRSSLWFSLDMNLPYTKLTKDYVRFAKVVSEVFPDLSEHIETPFGLYLTMAEAEKLRKYLSGLKQEKGKGCGFEQTV